MTNDLNVKILNLRDFTFRVLSEDGNEVGTAILVDNAKGYILTAKHIVDEASNAVCVKDFETTS